MKTRNRLSIAIAIPLALCATVSAEPLQAIDRPVHAAVSIDASGKVTAVTVVEKVPASIQSAIENRLKDLSFEPVVANGAPSAASTYVAMDVCAFPSGPAYRLAVNIAGNGPLLMREDRFEFPHALKSFGGQHLYAVIKLRARPDGHAELLEVQDVDVPPAVERDMRAMAKSWVWSLRFSPEQVAGQPVATDIEWPVEWFRMYGPQTRPMRRLPPRYPGNDPACRITTAPNDIPQRIDSPLRLRATPAAAPDASPK